MRSRQSSTKFAPQAQQLLASLNDRTVELKVTIARVNDLLNDSNRANPGGNARRTLVG